MQKWTPVSSVQEHYLVEWMEVFLPKTKDSLQTCLALYVAPELSLTEPPGTRSPCGMTPGCSTRNPNREKNYNTHNSNFSPETGRSGCSFALGRWKSKAKSKHVCIGWVYLRTICKYEIISIKGNKKRFDVCQQEGALTVRTKKTLCKQILIQLCNLPHQILFQWFRAEMPHYLVQQMNENFPDKSWKPLVNPASALWLSLTGAKGYNRNILPFNFWMPWITLNVILKCEQDETCWYFLSFSFPFSDFVFSFCAFQHYLWLLETKIRKLEGKIEILKLG